MLKSCKKSSSFGKESKTEMGRQGEKIACKFLKKTKYKILEKNYKNKIGEIDIIAKDQDTIVFVEVKTKTTEIFGLPREMVDERKQRKIEQVATVYLMQNGLFNSKTRFDVVEVLDKQVHHIKNAW